MWMLKKEPLHYRDHPIQSHYGRREHVFKEWEKKKKRQHDVCNEQRDECKWQGTKHSKGCETDFLIRHDKKCVSRSKCLVSHGWDLGLVIRMCWSMAWKATGLRERTGVEKRAEDRSLGWSIIQGQQRNLSGRSGEKGGASAHCDIKEAKRRSYFTLKRNQHVSHCWDEKRQKN